MNARSSVPAAAHPAVLGAAVLIVVNDFGLRVWAPGWLSGKLSDAAFLVVAPVFTAAILELTGIKAGLAKWIALSATALAYVTLQLWPPLGASFSTRHVADVGDLVVLPALLAAVWVWSRPPRARLSPVFALFPLAGALLATTPIDAVLPTPASWPCEATPAWDAYRPLELQLTYYPPDTAGFTEGMRLTSEDGNEVALIVARLDETGWLAVCARDGLAANTAYTWQIGPWEEKDPNELGFWHAALPTVHFVTGDAAGVRITDAAACADAQGLTTALQEACEPVADSGWTDPAA